MRIGILAVTGLAAAVAGCSQSEAEQRAEFKSEYTAACKQRSGELSNPAFEKTLDKNKYCECNGAKISEALSKEDLGTMASGGELTPARMKSISEKAGLQCLQDQGLQAALPGSAPAPAPAPAPAADEAEPAAEEVEE